MKLPPADTVLPFLGIAPRAGLRNASSSSSTLDDAAVQPGPGRLINFQAAAGGQVMGYCSWFRQPIDHNNPKMGYWNQQYCASPDWWAGPGSPVVFYTPGEEPIGKYVSSGMGYNFLGNTTMPGLHAQTIGAATVVLEHRYFGNSGPYDGLNSETLQYLTTEQAAMDVINFAQNVEFVFDESESKHSSNAPAAPWVYFGTSYSATLGSWIEQFHPGVFHAYHLSSAVVEVNTDNWYYYDTIRKGIDALHVKGKGKGYPGSCSSALNQVTEFVDGILLAEGGERDEDKVQALKMFFGASWPIEDDDFAYAIATPFRFWQETQGYRDILRLCNAVTADNHTIEGGVLGTVPAPVKSYASHFVQYFLDDTCEFLGVFGNEDPLWCLNTHSTWNSFFEARTLGNPWRTWYWFLCNEPLASWNTGAPPSEPVSIVSRRITAEYWQGQCELHFPAKNGQTYGSSSSAGVAARRSPATLNKKTGGWLRTNSTRVIWTNGEFDPWRATTMGSEIRPGGPLQGTDEVPVFLIKGAQHADDAFTAAGLRSRGWTINPEVEAVQEKAARIVKGWVDKFYEKAKNA